MGNWFQRGRQFWIVGPVLTPRIPITYRNSIVMMSLPSRKAKLPTLSEVRKWAKSDLHNHGLLGGKRSVVENFYGKRLSRFQAVGKGIIDLNQWIINEYRPFFNLPGSFEKALEAAFLQAVTDGVVLLEMSIDASFPRLTGITPARIITALRHYHQAIAPGVEFRPEIGFSRRYPADILIADFESFAAHDYFRAIDLYDEEDAQPVKNFRKLFQTAKKAGLKCKAHAGEFGSADSVKEAVMVLELDAVQHGIGAADSSPVMKWLCDHHIRLNTCPTSNIRLKRIRSFRQHPIRTLFDHGVNVTVNTDDALVFGDGVSEQYLKLLRAGVFNLEELKQIRNYGLED